MQKKPTFSLNDLYDIIKDRHDRPIAGSYTNALLDMGEDEILKKVGEEAVEVILAAKAQGNARLIEEMADLTYHILVLLVARGITTADIEAELEHRKR